MNMKQCDTPLEITRTLLRFNTVNPPGNERDCAEFMCRLVEDAGLNVTRHEFAEQRTCIVADLAGEGLPICFSGHIDTVPLGSAGWRCDPFEGEVDGDKLYGRGASDMKSGLAAMLHAALRIARLPGRRAGLSLVFTAGEENGCEGANFLARNTDALAPAGAIIIGEPSSNYPLLGHKGALWLDAETSGKSAHGSMPDQGDNALYKAAKAVSRLEAYRFRTDPHPVLGSPTLNVGTLFGGTHYNLVPDRATIGIDIRTIPGLTGEAIMRDLQSDLGPDVALELVTGADSIFTDPDQPWVQAVFDIMQGYLGQRPNAKGATYFTDAAALTPAMGQPPTIIMGPGEAKMAHKTDEYCFVDKIETAAEAYFEIARRWCER
jgi:succinyl-diaminopimelate desuccinylase